jgi:hypothetical protein
MFAYQRLAGPLVIMPPGSGPGHQPVLHYALSTFSTAPFGAISFLVGSPLSRERHWLSIALAFDHQRDYYRGLRRLARPMMRGGACLDADQAVWQLLEERHHVPALKLAADDDATERVVL